MLTLSQTLSYYKRRDVQELIIQQAASKEIGVRFGDSFGKRPDILVYENDVLESAKRGCTSLHCSEELWTNPLHLNPNLRRNELDNLRAGWDLILDIDCPYWNFSKLTTYIFIKALKDHGVDSVTVKFSGGKGFHIGVPFEAFPENVLGKNVKDIFPEGPRKITEYLLHYITENLIIIDKTTNQVKFGKINVSWDKLLKDIEKTEKDLTITKCEKCHRKVNEKNVANNNLVEYVCPHCETQVKDVDKRFMSCPKCNKLMEKQQVRKTLCECGSDKFKDELDLKSILNVDTVLISSRHMYRMAYSLHEKTGLVSVPFDIKHILKFDKSEGDVKTFKPYKYLDRENARRGEAENLFQKAFDYIPEKIIKRNDDIRKAFIKEKNQSNSMLDAPEDKIPIPEEYFPPCIQKISRGLEDAKKRGLLVLINFLSSCNWDYDMIEEYILKWNERNKPEQLRETYVRGQLRYYKQQAAQSKDKMIAPNCDNKGYMHDTQFCNPDGLCRNIKNPVQYAKKKAWLAGQEKPKERKKKESDTKKQADITNKKETGDKKDNSKSKKEDKSKNSE